MLFHFFHCSNENADSQARMAESARSCNCYAKGPRNEHRPYFLLFGQLSETLIGAN